MKPAHDLQERFPVADATALKVTIIYEDFPSGLRAKHFAELLGECLDCSSQFSETFWRSDLLACPPVADEAASLAADCDYIIVSLRGDQVVPSAARRWIEAQLDGAAGHGLGLIALVSAGGVVEPGGETWRAGAGARHDLRSLCAGKNVPFFCHSQTVPVDGALANLHRGEEVAEPEGFGAHWTPGWSLSEIHHDLRHEFLHRR